VRDTNNPILRMIAFMGNISRLAGMAWKGNPSIGYNMGSVLPGHPLPKLDNVHKLANVMQTDPWVMVGVTRIAQNVAASPLVAQAETRMDGNLGWINLEVGPLAELLKRPNQLESWDILLWKLTMSLFTGDAFLVFDDSPGILALYHCRPQIIRAVVSKATGDLDHWVITYGNKEKRLELEQVIHITYPSILHDIYGQSPITALSPKVALNEYYSNHLATFFQKHAVPTGILTTEQSVDESVIAETKKQWIKAYAGTANAHQIAVIGDGTTYTQISPPLKDLMVDALHTIPRDTTLSALGVPPVIAGVEVANYATAREQRRSFWQDTIIPWQRVICAALTIQLARKYGDNYRIQTDNSQIEALQPDRNKQAQRAYRLYQGQLATRNEAREMVNLEPVDDGDEFKETPTAVALTGTDDGGVADRSLAEPRSAEENIWQAHYVLAQQHEKSLATLMRQYWLGQEKRAQEALKAFMIGRNSLSHIQMVIAIKAKGGGLLDPESEDAKLKDKASPFIDARINEAGGRAVNQVRVDLTFDVTNPAVSLMKDQVATRIVGINETTYTRIQELLDESYTEGWGYDLTAQKLKELYGDFSTGRAMVIARTETGAMINGGSFLGYGQAGVEKKKWLPAYLPTSRAWHTAMGTVEAIPLNQRFMVGGEAMMYPNDTNASARNVVNCYCTLLPVIAEDEE